MIRRNFLQLIVLLLCTFSTATISANATPGPIIKEFGPTWAVELDVPVDLDANYRVVFDVANYPGEADSINRSLVTVARFLNMHGRAGIPVEQLEVVAVLHGEALKGALTNDAYRARYDVDNPNLVLIRALQDAGVTFQACGQSMGAREFAKGELTANIEVALSAMTVLTVLQNDGFALIPW